MKFDNSNLENFGGVTAGLQQEDRWQYPGVGYNATDGIFYIGEEKASRLIITPFAMRQCKEVTDAAGIVHRYPIKTRRTDMAEGDTVTRLQVAGLVNGELHIFGARSWTARAAWANPLSGPWHDDRFAGGIWPQLMSHIKDVRAQTGRQTAPLCWEVTLTTGAAIDLSSAANAKQKSKGCPIVAEGVSFVGAAQAAANEQLYIDEAIGDWVAEWNKTTVTEAAATDPNEFTPLPETSIDDIPF